MIREGDINGPCPNCGQSTLKMTNVLYSCPLQFTAVCENCDFSTEGEGEPIQVMNIEDAIKKRPEMYLESDNPEWKKLAEHTLSQKKEIE